MRNERTKACLHNSRQPKPIVEALAGIQHYCAWLRHIGDCRSNIRIGSLTLEIWTGKEKQRAREISSRYYAHSAAAPGPNDTVKVAYRFRNKVENFSLSSKEVTDLRDEVLPLVSKYLDVTFEVSCGSCGEKSSAGLLACGHVHYSTIVDQELPFEFIRPLNSNVIAIFSIKSDVSKGTDFTRSILTPTLAEGLDITQLASPVGDIETGEAWRDSNRVFLRLFAPQDTFSGAIRELGLFWNDTLMLYSGT